MKKILMVLLLTTLFQGFAMANDYKIENQNYRNIEENPLTINELASYFQLCYMYNIDPDLELTDGRIMTDWDLAECEEYWDNDYPEWVFPAMDYIHSFKENHNMFPRSITYIILTNSRTTTNN